MKVTRWIYGITTVPKRLNELFPRTLASLKAAGFDQPRIFVDGTTDRTVYQAKCADITVRHPQVGLAGNWLLSMWELFLRNPEGTHFALFQDDIVVCKNLKEYLTRCKIPEAGYWNLCTYPDNEELIKEEADGWHPSNQRGRGAQGLVFSRKMVMTLLSQYHLLDRAQDPKRGRRLIDGGISHAMRAVHRLEYIHKPSLLCHTGVTSVSGNHAQPTIRSFPGEDYDPLTLL